MIIIVILVFFRDSLVLNGVMILWCFFNVINVWVIVEMYMIIFCSGLKNWYKNFFSGYLMNNFVIWSGVRIIVIKRFVIVMFIMNKLYGVYMFFFVVIVVIIMMLFIKFVIIMNVIKLIMIRIMLLLFWLVGGSWVLFGVGGNRDVFIIGGNL